MSDDENSPDAFHRSDAAALFLRQIQNDGLVPAFKCFGARKVKGLVATTSAEITKAPRPRDYLIPFSVRQARTLLGYTTDIANLCALKMIEMEQSHTAKIATLMARVQHMEQIINEQLDARARESAEE